MPIIRQDSLFDRQELFEMEPTHRFNAIFSRVELGPLLRIFDKKTRRGAPRELNYGAMIYSLIARVVERVNAYLKEYFDLNNVRHRTGKKAKVHFQFVTLIYNASRLASDRLKAAKQAVLAAA